MRTLSFLLFAALGGAQTPPPIPQNPLELVTGGAQAPATAADRGALVVLLNRAVDHYSLHARGTPAHVLQITFTAAGSTLYPGGAGSLRETWISGQNWRWDGALADYKLSRISSNGAVFDQNPNSRIPLRIKMVANAVFAPIEGAPRRDSLRSANVTWKNTTLTCILKSVGPNIVGETAAAAGARQWDETEYCIDPATGLLNVYSMVPGIYTLYDYASPLQFHGRILPGRITISEDGATVVDAQLTGVAETDPSGTSAFTPTAQMISQGPAMMLGSPALLRMPFPVPEGTAIDPVFVHAIVDEHGKVQEYEPLQTTGATAHALEFIRGINFGQARPASGAGSIERELFIDVRAQPIASGRGPQPRQALR
jgi:hypothetical protein